MIEITTRAYSLPETLKGYVLGYRFSGVAGPFIGEHGDRVKVDMTETVYGAFVVGVVTGLALAIFQRALIWAIGG